MRTSFLILVLSLLWNSLYAQDPKTEQMIRALEQKERQATLEKDTATLRNLWAEDLTVNSPFNRVVRGGRNTLDRPVITQLNYASFERRIEDVLIKGDMAVSMGSEVVVEKGSDNRQGRTLNRRYTNIWQNQKGQWKLVARHANLVCSSR